MSTIAMRGPRRAIRSLPLMLLLVAAACGGDTPAVEAPDPTVTLGQDDVVIAVARAVEGGVSVTGSLDPVEQVELKSQVASTVTSVRVDRGSRVQRGATLLVLDAQGFAAAYASARAQLAAAARDLEAADTLYKAGAVSERDFVNARAARDAAQARVTEMRQDVDRTTVRAPIHGVVSARSVNDGEAVRVGDALLTIVRTDTLEMEAKVSAAAIGSVVTGQSVVLRIDAYPGRDVRGRVSRIEPVADPATRQVSIFITVPNRDASLVGGLFATGVIVTTGSPTTDVAPIAIPATAVRGTEGATEVSVIVADTIVTRPVTIGVKDVSGWVSVLSGLAAGDKVVVDGSSAPAAGTPVRIGAATNAAPGGAK